MNKSKILDEINKYIGESEMSFLIGAGFSRNVSKQAYLLRFESHSSKVIPEKDADELFCLSNLSKFNSPHSTAHYKATDVQFMARHYFRDGAPKSDRMVFALLDNQSWKKVKGYPVLGKT